MKQLLAIDTTTEACSVALSFNDKGSENIIGRYQLAPRLHAELILSMVDDVLNEANLSLKQLDALAVTIGPGAFTGVRLGVAVAQGLAFASGLKVIPVNTLETLAYGAISSDNCGDCHIAVAMDARMKEVYWACFEYKLGKIISITPQNVIPVSMVPLPTEAISPDWLLAGTGWKVYSESFKKKLSFEPDCSDNLELPTAENALFLAKRDFAQAVEAELITPLYLRDKVAETIIERQAKKLLK